MADWHDASVILSFPMPDDQFLFLAELNNGAYEIVYPGRFDGNIRWARQCDTAFMGDCVKRVIEISELRKDRQDAEKS